MARETRIKVKRSGRFVDVNDLPEVRRAEQPPAKLPTVNVTRLPKPSKLNKDVPLEQLFVEHKEVRAYITEDGKMRGGLSPKAQKKAEQILERYGGK
jgi:hypothetical protein